MSTSAYPILGLKTCCDTCFYFDTCTKKDKQHEILNMLEENEELLQQLCTGKILLQTVCMDYLYDAER